MFNFMANFREQTLAATKLFLSLIRIDFAVLVSSRVVRISSRAVRVFPALSLRRVRPSYGTFSLMVFQGNCARGRTGHMIIAMIHNQHHAYFVAFCNHKKLKHLKHSIKFIFSNTATCRAQLLEMTLGGTVKKFCQNCFQQLGHW